MNEQLVPLASACGRSMSLKRVSAHGRVAGLLLSMTVRQAYRNDTPDTLETVYTCPLAWGAVLTGLAVEIGGRRLQGAVLARRQARERYEEAVASGDAPVMVERRSDALYAVNLGSLKPGEEATIELRYAQLLTVEQGRVRLSVPTTVAPRYGDPHGDAGLAPHEVPQASLDARYPFDLRLDVDGPLADGDIRSPTHAIGVSRGERGATVRLARTGWLDRDLVIAFEGAPATIGAGTAFAVRAPDGAGCVALASFCPRIDAPPRESLALKVLVDCSGSMAGDSIAAARRALARVTGALAPADRFSYSRFGSRVVHESDGLQPASPRALAIARAAIERTDANLGGTEIAGALASTFGHGDARDADVLLITDGQVWAIDEVVAQARASGHRVFAVGVGSAPAESLLRRLAEATGGACELVAPGEAIEAAVDRSFARMRVPATRDLRVDWGATPAWTTPLPASLFDGDTVHVFAGFDAPAPALAPCLAYVASDAGRALPGRMTAEVQDAPGAPDVGGADPSEADASLAATLPRIAAWRRIAALEPSGAGERAAGRDRGRALHEASELALRYRLVTEHTNLFLVHVRAEDDKATDLPALQRIEHMLAAGWGGTGSVHAAREAPSVAGFAEPAALAYVRPRFALLPDPADDALAARDAFPPYALEGAPVVRERPRRGADHVPGSSPAARRTTPRRVLALARARLRRPSDIDALVDALKPASTNGPLADALSALARHGLDERDAWLVVMAWLAASLGDSALPGPVAGRVLGELLAALPADRRDAAMRHAGAALGSATLDAW